MSTPHPHEDPEGYFRARSRSFGADAAGYDTHRPRYPRALYDCLFHDLPPNPVTLDIGAGTGKATVDLLSRGAVVTAIEPDPAMLEMGRSNAPEAQWLNTTFEAAPLEPATFDLVTAAQSWHWVDVERGPALAANALRPGGWLATFWHTPRPVDGGWREELDEVYRRVVPGLADQTMMAAGLDPGYRAILAGSDLFESLDEHTFDWHRDMHAADYCSLLHTHSDHKLLPDDDRARLFAEVAAVIDRHAGIRVGYRTVLYRCQRR